MAVKPGERGRDPAEGELDQAEERGGASGGIRVPVEGEGCGVGPRHTGAGDHEEQGHHQCVEIRSVLRGEDHDEHTRGANRHAGQANIEQSVRRETAQQASVEGVGKQNAGGVDREEHREQLRRHVIHALKDKGGRRDIGEQRRERETARQGEACEAGVDG